MEIAIIPNTAINGIIETNWSIDQLINNFILDMDVKPQSKDVYRRTLRLFIDWTLSKGINLKYASRADVLAYKQSLIDRKLSELTIGSYLVTVRLFFEWAEGTGLVRTNVARGVKTPKKHPGHKKEPLTWDQVHLLLSSIDRTTLQGKRDYAILNLLLMTGLRTVEITRADIKDLSFKSGKRVLFILGKGKNSKDDYAKLPDPVFKPIEEYLEARGPYTESEPLFISLSNNYKAIIKRRSKNGFLSEEDAMRLTTRTISFIAKETLKSVGLNSKKLTAHSFRHTAAVNHLQMSNNIEETMTLMRHASTDTTRIYVATLKERQRLENTGEDMLASFYENFKSKHPNNI